MHRVDHRWVGWLGKGERKKKKQGIRVHTVSAMVRDLGGDGRRGRRGHQAIVASASKKAAPYARKQTRRVEGQRTYVHRGSDCSPKLADIWPQLADGEP
jgi:hypothetical protein